MKVWMICVIVSMSLMGCNFSKKGDATSYERSGRGEENPVVFFETPHVFNYSGLIPDEDSLTYDLTITKNENVSDGNYILITITKDQENSKAQSASSRGQLYTIRGCEDDKNATVYKLVDEIDDHIRYFKVTGGNSLQLLTNQLCNPGKENGVNYNIFLVQ